MSLLWIRNRKYMKDGCNGGKMNTCGGERVTVVDTLLGRACKYKDRMGMDMCLRDAFAC